MKRYVAFLRGVMPGKPSMTDLKKAFEKAGFTDVKTVLTSGNVVFSCKAASEAALERRAEESMKMVLGKVYVPIVRSVDALQELLAADPFAGIRLKPDSKRVVTFLRKRPDEQATLPDAIDGARVVAVTDREAFTVYWPNPRGPVFMTLIEKTFGKDVTTRTWETVGKVTK